MSDVPEARLVHLSSGEIDEVVGVLRDAFRDYPVMRFILSDAGGDYEEQLDALLAYFTDSRMSRGWPVLGVRVSDRLVAAANVTPPERTSPPASLQRRGERLALLLGPEAMDRFAAFAASGERFTPREPHYYLGMIGVLPELQGRGLARLILDEVHRLSEAHSGSTGVLLTTETERNLPLYERFGYTVIGRAEVEDLISWSLFRPDP